MSFRVYLHPKADDFLNVMDLPTRERIKGRLQGLVEKTNKKGKPYIPPLQIIRIGVYRAIYEIIWNELKVNVLFIDHKDNVYNNFKRMFLQVPKVNTLFLKS